MNLKEDNTWNYELVTFKKILLNTYQNMKQIYR